MCCLSYLFVLEKMDYIYKYSFIPKADYFKHLLRDQWYIDFFIIRIIKKEIDYTNVYSILCMSNSKVKGMYRKMRRYILDQLIFFIIGIWIISLLPWMCGYIISFTIISELITILSLTYLCRRILILPLDCILKKVQMCFLVK